MWVFLKDSFLSIVADSGHKDRLLVRARIKGDLERAFPSAQVFSLKRSDYRYRAFIDRAEVARTIAAQVEAITYPNFKDEVQRVSGGARHHAYFDVWAVMRDYQNAEPL
jgi:hypothetical protein